MTKEELLALKQRVTDSEDVKSRVRSAEIAEQVARFLANGGQIQRFEPCARSVDYPKFSINKPRE